MRLVLQRVSSASVTVEAEVVGAIDDGVLLLVAVEPQDTEATARNACRRVCELRMFEDATGRMNRSLEDCAGQVLVVSQFTLAASFDKGRRPSFHRAAERSHAESMCRYLSGLFAQALGASAVAAGRFGAQMSVSLVNEGPVTFVLDL